MTKLFSLSQWQNEIWSNGKTKDKDRSLFVGKPNILIYNARNGSLKLRVFEEIQSKSHQTNMSERNIFVLDNNPGQLHRFNRTLSHVDVFKFYPTYRTLKYGKLQNEYIIMNRTDFF